MHTRLVEQVKMVRGDVCDQALLERTLGEYEIDTVIHLAAQTIVGIANRNPVSTVLSTFLSYLFRYALCLLAPHTTGKCQAMCAIY